ncbi:flagellar outer dynein arm heavy chain beta [Pavlovales sp. CCMP2436]|nr:flagellar outer dynein arm heavy chain beta [Pavlovales sp. CCMP2436]
MGDAAGGDANVLLQWFEDRIVSLLKVKGEVFRKLGEDDKRPLNDFASIADVPTLFVLMGAKDLSLFNGVKDGAALIAGAKKKVLYFRKRNPVKLTSVNVQSEVLWGDMSPSPLLHIFHTGQDVFTPVLTNPRNQEFMSEIVSSQLSEAMHKTVSQVYVALGQSMGKTLLAVPPGEMLRSDGSSGKDKDRVHVLETSVVTWTAQIKNVLKTQPEAALSGADNPGPLVGISFWEEKAGNLSSIREQLSSDRIKKLDRVEIGGNKGKQLTEIVADIFAEFNRALEKMKAVTYDILDISVKQFDDDFYAFRATIKELEERLGGVINQGFDTAVTIQNSFKLLDSFADLLERDWIQSSVERKHLDLITQYGNELRTVQDLFQQNRNASLLGRFYERDGPPLYTNMPPVSGALYWVRGLIARVEQPMAHLSPVMRALAETDETRDVARTYEAVASTLHAFEADMYGNWCSIIDDVSTDKLSQNLLVRTGTGGEVSVNFDMALVCLLRETRYFKHFGKEIPTSAEHLYTSDRTYRQWIGSLEIVSFRYNHMLHTMLEVEKPLLKTQMKAIDKALEKGLRAITWKSAGIDEFIGEAMSLVSEAYDTLASMKEIHALVAKSNAELKVSKRAPAWRHYVEFMANICVDGLQATVVNSLTKLLQQIKPADGVPMIEVRLGLQVPDVRFTPELEQRHDGTSVLDKVDGWVGDFFSAVRLIKRLDHPDCDFAKEVEESEEVRFAVHRINTQCEENQERCNEFRQPFRQHKSLWLSDIETELHKFVDSAAPAESASEGAPPAKGAEAAAEAGGVLSSHQPSLEAFDAQIAKYKGIQEAIIALPTSVDKGWLRIDSRPVKDALKNAAGKWVYAFTHHLETRVTLSVHELMGFFQTVVAGLGEDVDPEDHARLLVAMTHMRDVRRREESIDQSWVPLRGMVALLRKYQISIDEKVLEQLENAPFKWEEVKKAAINAREALGPLQALQAEKVKEEVEDFVSRMDDFTAIFKEEAPFKYDVSVERAYPLLDAWHRKLEEIELDAFHSQGQEELFDLTVHPFKELKTARAELNLLKLAWDHAALVQETFASYRSTLWKDVDVDGMVDETKQLLKQIKALPKQLVKWDVQQQLVADMQTMMIDLPLVQDLRDDAMRERHWKKLMRTTGRTFELNDKLALDHLLACKLSLFQDPVSEITEQARQEVKIDLALTKIANIWSGLKLEYEPFRQTGVACLLMPGEVYEALDDNELQLQNMMGNRFMGHFETQITDWKGKLAKTRSVVDIWMEVQRAWCSLESIFLGSEDIREQLPEDAKRFDQVDSDFREQMNVAKEQPNPIEAAMTEGREEIFNRCQAALDLCQKSLSDYLEVKKKKFPRFYFVAPADLIDILSKGRNPPAVQEHFSKFTDNTGKFDFVRDESGKETGVVKGMTSTDDEYVPFSTEFACEGQVEDWLSGLMAFSCDEVRLSLHEAINSFVELPRHEWLYKYPAQMSLTTGQVWWTTEVNSAFERLEQGNENALKDYLQIVIGGLKTLVDLVLGNLSRGDRIKFITLITVEVHARDIVQRMINQRIDNAGAFAWQSQLKYRWDEESANCLINICDAEMNYCYEYVGNTGRLVITALTDRCYITLTQALRLILGGAPAGPAGTGKTETTKDLGRGLAIWVIVQNCSDQMTNKVMANFFSGLAQTGAWGCFDEFNRISVEVLSVVAGQYLTILDGIRSKKTLFTFEEDEITLNPTVGAFITMNPGYAGRTELPENLKALFRPCAMVVPDFGNIAEISLNAEGFLEAKELGHKFVTLFALCQELLSKQYHYDWGLRAMKGVLRIAGGMKRDEPDKTEKQILMRALRDVNLPKFVLADFGIFLGLITDLFPRVDSPPKTDPALVKGIREVIAMDGSGLQPEEVFVTKIANLAEMLGVRHCCFILGAAGAAKTKLWKTLAASWSHLNMGGGATQYQALNPKAITVDDLYGYMHPVTKEPFDGIISKMMRDYSRMETEVPKWIVLDGDIDAEWIESMNTVMDDNKVLTLVSNERIPLTGSMRLIFEISHLRNASPATVSRAGVIFLNESDIGWRPFVTTWVETMGDQKVATTLEQLFDQYVAPTLDHFRREKWKHVTPLMDFAMVQTLCKLLEGLLTKENVPAGSDKEVYEAYFQFAAIWALGGGFNVEKGSDMRKLFSDFWRSEFAKSAIRFPDEGLVFDFYISPVDKRPTHWNDRIDTYKHDVTGKYSDIVVSTLDTTRIGFLAAQLLDLNKPVMLVGGPGTAKTCLLAKLLREMPEEKTTFFNINFNSFTGADSLQPMLEQPLEKKTGSSFGPPGTKKLIYFIDDFNMPAPDKYGTQSAIELARQQVDYGGFYDLKKLTFKSIIKTSFVGAMNPLAGSFYIIDRMQRHFATFAAPPPEADVCRMIYGKIFAGHLERFAPAVADKAEHIVAAAVNLHLLVADTFLPNAIKFHYQWNLRELSNIFQGMCNTLPEVFKEPKLFARLWVHEAMRVYSDRLISVEDQDKFRTELVVKAARELEDFIKPDVLMEEPIIFANFAGGGDEKVYSTIESHERLSSLLTKKLGEYNEVNATMDLHVVRISRIIDSPRGNAMLVGSLSRLSAFISGYSTFQIKLSPTYGVADFKLDLMALYNKVGLKSEPTQIFKDSGVIPDLYNDEDKDTVKAAGLLDTRDNCWAFFIDKVRANLHVIMCMSPFPALSGCTTIDWFMHWPQEALISDVEMETPEHRAACGEHMAFVHESYKASLRRNVYTTPKSYLELIALYKQMLAAERARVSTQTTRLETGLIKLRESSEQVADMQFKLTEESAVVAVKSKETDLLIIEVGKESNIAADESEKAAIEEEKVTLIQTEVSAFQAQCLLDLAAAEPALKAAEDALNLLDKNSLTELKSLGTPPPAVLKVTAACAYMLAPVGTNLKKLDVSWNAGKKMMGSPEQFLQQLLNFDKDNLWVEAKDNWVRNYTGPPDKPDPEFTYENMATKSKAAAGLCAWVVNICIYHDIFLDVEPKRIKLAEAEKTLKDANDRLVVVRKRVQDLNDKCAALQQQLSDATDEKNRLIEKAESTAKRLNLAERLVNGLKDEGVRWTHGVDELKAQLGRLVGDILVTASFIAYIGPFNMSFRQRMINEQWIPDVRARGIPSSDSIVPVKMLSGEATVAEWNSQGLPADALSIENGAIITQCSRWPLIVDPQLQGVTWIKQREEKNGLVVTGLGAKGYIDKVIRAMQEGLPILLENIGENIDAVLEPVIARSFIKKGRKLMIKIGDAELDVMSAKDADGMATEYPAFKMYIQTKLPNPHYIPEIQAQTTMINFTVTEKGLEDQLLNVVVNKERPDLEEARMALVEQQNQFTIKLKELEDDLLYRLATAEGDILSDEDLIISLEVTKVTVTEINVKVKEGKVTEDKINEAREAYRPTAARGSIIYFLLNQLNVIDHMYQFSLGAFNFIFSKALNKAEATEEGLKVRCNTLLDSVQYTIFSYVTRGLFERHRLIFSCLLTMKVLQSSGELLQEEIDLLIKAPKNLDRENPCSVWLLDAAWFSVVALSSQEAFANLPQDVEGSWKRWKEWIESEQPEKMPLPQEWKRLGGFQRLQVVRAVRPDRMMLAIALWVRESIGNKYVDAIPFNLKVSFEDSAPAVPIFFLLSPGVDPVVPLGKTEEAGKFVTVSLGQGQEPVAEKALDRMFVEGGWVMLQNIELVARWLPKLEKKLESLIDGAHPEFRVFLSALPQKAVPVPILQNSIKLTNEPPSGLKANMLRSYLLFNNDIWDSSSKQSEMKSVVFALCFFHSVVCERRKFGPIGWNRGYPFNEGDLTVCIKVGYNYLEANAKIPWDDLQYIFGEIMYGGHITDNWDRRLCMTYLSVYIKNELNEGLELFPGFATPPPMAHKEYMEYVSEQLDQETPTAYGLHPNSEINFMTKQADELFKNVAELQPRGGGGAGGMTMQEKVKRLLDDILERLPEQFSMYEIEERIDERTPYTSVFLQEVDRMSQLIYEMRRSLVELDKGLRGDLSMTEAMEGLMDSIYDDMVPDGWNRLGWPSLRPLGSWLADMLARYRQIADWTADLATPKSTWISGLFNPQAFLTAVMQVTARKNEWPLDNLEVIVEVTKKMLPEEIDAPTRDGAYIHGLYAEGARWDTNTNTLEDALMKQLYPPLPVVLVKSAMQSESKDIYRCPVYKTQQRGPTFVFTAGLRTKAPPSKWVLAGLALVMDVVE